MAGYRFELVYFDRSIIRRNWKAINRNPIQKAGVIVMLNARDSIKRRKKSTTYSKPNSAPYTHPPAYPFKRIYSESELFGTRAVVGMVGFGGPQPVPGLHEHGGTAVRRVFVKGPQRRTKLGRFGRRTMMPVVKSVRYEKRPFMAPALEKARRAGKLPPLWANCMANIPGAKAG